MMDLHQFVQGHTPTADPWSQLPQAEAALDAFTEAFNACDLQRVDQALHFPHVMLSGSQTLIWQTPGQHPADFFEQLRGTGWRYTQYEARQPVWRVQDKVHFVVSYTRRDGEDRILSTHTNLWIVTCQEGRWAVALRSY